MSKLRKELFWAVLFTTLVSSFAPALAQEASTATAQQVAPSAESVETASGPAVVPTREETREAREKARRERENKGLEHFELARYYMSRFNLKMAELEYEVSIMYYPDMRAAHRDYCVASILRGHPMRALAELMMVVGLGEPVPLDEKESVALCQHATKLHYREGVAYGRAGKWDRAIAEFKWALEYAPGKAEIERSLAFSYASKGNFEMAENCYSRSFSEDPSDGYSHADFAFLLADSGHNDQAMKQLSEAVKLEPKVAALHIDMGWMAESKGDFSTAKNELEQAIQLSPKHAELWAHLGRVLERLGKADQARNAYSAALAIDPGQNDAKEALQNMKHADSVQPKHPPDEHHQQS